MPARHELCLLLEEASAGLTGSSMPALSRKYLVAACLSLLCIPHPASAEALLPGVLDVTPIPGTTIVNDCGAILLPGEDRPTKFTCVYFLDSGGDERFGMNGPSAATFTAWTTAMEDAGWKFAHLAVYEFYFERPKPDTECSDVAVMIALPDLQTKALVDSSPSNGPFEDRPWRGFVLQEKTFEACGTSRYLG